MKPDLLKSVAGSCTIFNKIRLAVGSVRIAKPFEQNQEEERHMGKACRVWTILLLAAAWWLLPAAMAAGAQDMGGWEIDGAYNKLYKANEADNFKAEVIKVIEVTPLPGMAPGVGLLVKDQDDVEVTVHIGPRWFVNPRGLGVHRGTRIKLKGVWVEIEGKEVFIASKFKNLGNDKEYKVRLTKNGKPFWTMTSAELAKERTSD